jgi:hypothetical protein
MACRWCPHCERAWLAHPWRQAPQWHPVPRGMLVWAMGWARAGGCADQVTVEEVACEQCATERATRETEGRWVA